MNLRTLAIALLIPQAGCSSGTIEPTNEDAGASPSTGESQCGTLAEDVCTRACACPAACKIYFTSQYFSQGFGSKDTCKGAYERFCQKQAFDMDKCNADLQTATCKSVDFGSGLGLPPSCM